MLCILTGRRELKSCADYAAVLRTVIIRSKHAMRRIRGEYRHFETGDRRTGALMFPLLTGVRGTWRLRWLYSGLPTVTRNKHMTRQTQGKCQNFLMGDIRRDLALLWFVVLCL
jgi:hypothetical protein